MRFGRGQKHGRRQRTRVLFATDLHGSEIVFRKFLNAIPIYEADVAILGGDLTGKRLLPIARDGGVHRAHLGGEAVELRTDAELDEFRERVRNLGQYPIVLSAEEMADMHADPAQVEAAFERECQAQTADWMARAAERLQPLGIPLYVTGGNDDFLSIEGVLDAAEWATNAEGRVLEIAPGVAMISTGYGNPTPWRCPRDVSEDELAARIETMAERLDDARHALFNLHVPPHGSGLDLCPRLDTSVDPPRPLAGESIAAGSTAVIEAIRAYAPAVSLHGHIHESAGIRHIGPTTAINPGSEYGEGVLRSAVVDIAGDDVAAQLLTA